MKSLRFNALRVRLMTVFSLAFLLLLVLLLSITNVYFKTYYISSNEKVMARVVHDYLGQADNGPTPEALQILQRNSGGQVVLYNDQLQSIGWGDVAAPREDNQELGALAQRFNRVRGLTPERLEDLYRSAIEGGGDYFTNSDEMLYYTYVFKDGNMLLLSKQMGILEEAEKMFKSFLTLTAALVYVIGLMIVFFITKQVTKPIFEMVDVTAKMAQLDFHETLKPKGADETRQLMTSINTMAEELSSTIDQLHKSNAQLESELSKERSLEKMRRQFVSDVSHELKNPLSMIMGYTDGLRQHIPKTEADRLEYYDIIMDESQRMNQLVKDLLDLSGYESGTFTIHKEETPVKTLIQDVIERFSYVMKDKAVQIEWQMDQDIMVYADPLRLSQIVINILSNAFKHVEVGGKIRIHVEAMASKVAMTFANTGDLIPEESLEDIWHSFYQVDTESSGNGLGLAIVKSIVKLHQGTCRAYVVDAYNCFEIVL